MILLHLFQVSDFDKFISGIKWFDTFISGKRYLYGDGSHVYKDINDKLFSITIRPQYCLNCTLGSWEFEQKIVSHVIKWRKILFQFIRINFSPNILICCITIRFKVSISYIPRLFFKWNVGRNDLPSAAYSSYFGRMFYILKSQGGQPTWLFGYRSHPKIGSFRRFR